MWGYHTHIVQSVVCIVSYLWTANSNIQTVEVDVSMDVMQEGKKAYRLVRGQVELC